MPALRGHAIKAKIDRRISPARNRRGTFKKISISMTKILSKTQVFRRNFHFRTHEKPRNHRTFDQYKNLSHFYVGFTATVVKM